MESWKKKIGFSIFILQAVLFIVWLIYSASQYNLYADDLWYLQYTRSGNLVRDLHAWFTHSNGRYFTAIVQILMFYLPPHFIYPVTISLFIVGLFLSVFLFCKIWCKRSALTFFVSFLLFEFIVLGLPAKRETLFWPSALFTHSIGVIGLMIYLSVLFSSPQKPLLLHWMFALMMAGIGETAGFSFAALTAFAYLISHQKHYILTFLIFSVGWLLHFLIPASMERLTSLHEGSQISYMHAFFASAKQNLFMLPQTLLIAVAWGCTTCLVNLRPLFTKPNNVILFVTLFWMFYLMFIAFLMKDAEPMRASIFPHLLTWLLLGWTLGEKLKKSKIACLRQIWC